MKTQLEDVVIFHPQIDVWSGAVKVNRENDLKDTTLPPKSILSDGVKRLVDPKNLNALETVRRGVNRELAQLGIRIAGGFGVPTRDEAAAHDLLAEAGKKFEAARSDMLANLDAWYADWEGRSEHAPYQALLRGARLSAEDVGERTSFAYGVFVLGRPQAARSAERFEAVAKGALPALIEDVAKTASDILDRSFSGRAKVTQRAVEPVRRLCRKLEGFGMLDPRVIPAAQALGRIIEGIPKTGPLDETATMIVRSMLRGISDGEQILRMGELSLAAGDTEELDDETTDADSGQPALFATA